MCIIYVKEVFLLIHLQISNLESSCNISKLKKVKGGLKTLSVHGVIITNRAFPHWVVEKLLVGAVATFQSVYNTNITWHESQEIIKNDGL